MNRSNSRQAKVPKIQVTSYQLDACELLSNRIHKKLREHFDIIKAFAIYQEVSPHLHQKNFKFKFN